MPDQSGQQRKPRKPLGDYRSDLADEWHPTRNGSITPQDVGVGGREKHWWICPKNTRHEWQASPSNRAFRGSGCPYCSGLKVTPENSLQSVAPHLTKEWHPSRNGDLTPAQITAGSNKKHWWKCDMWPDHEWRASPANRIRGGTGCPFCRGLRASKSNSLQSLFPELASQWHPVNNGDLTPEAVVAGSAKIYWWKCPNGPDHEWIAAPETRMNLKTGCPCCANRKLSVTNSLATVSPKLAGEFHPTKNGSLSPETVIAGARMSVWWKCLDDPSHEWEAGLYSRLGNNRGCPYCYQKGRGWKAEAELFTLLEGYFDGEVFERQARPLWLSPQHLDIYLPQHAIAIEYQGRQHFEPVEFFGGEEAYQKNLERDARKLRLCKENGVRLVFASKGYSIEEMISKIERLMNDGT